MWNLWKDIQSFPTRMISVISSRHNMCRPSTDRGDCIPNILPFTNTETLLNFNYRITVSKNEKNSIFQFYFFRPPLMFRTLCWWAPLRVCSTVQHLSSFWYWIFTCVMFDMENILFNHISMVCTMMYMGYTLFRNLQGCSAEHFTFWNSVLNTMCGWEDVV